MEVAGIHDPAVLAAIPVKDLHRAAFWLRGLSQDWRGDVPLKLHESRGRRTPEGTLPFSSDFVAYVGFIECGKPGCIECRKERQREREWRNPEPRLRATRAFRKLRKVAPREFDVLYLYCVQRQTVSAITIALNERAARLDKEDRYSNVSVILLLLSGIDKVLHWY